MNHSSFNGSKIYMYLMFQELGLWVGSPFLTINVSEAVSILYCSDFYYIKFECKS